jgi:pyruvate/2-oxoglutarate dehydrogenase complex dihydrolipoamide dehydrogenase (E3) component
MAQELKPDICVIGAGAGGLAAAAAAVDADASVVMVEKGRMGAHRSAAMAAWRCRP